MNMPGFDAEASLGPARGIYRGKAVHLGSSGDFVARLDAVKPQQLGLGGVGTTVGLGDCFGSTEKCIREQCAGLPVKQQGLCRSACAQPSKCDSCPCKCSPNCVRTCQRTCTRGFVSASGSFILLTCRGSCFGDQVAEQ